MAPDTKGNKPRAPLNTRRTRIGRYIQPFPNLLKRMANVRRDECAVKLF
jgi:hypothetical protein